MLQACYKSAVVDKTKHSKLKSSIEAGFKRKQFFTNTFCGANFSKEIKSIILF